MHAAAFDTTLFLEILFASFIFDLSCSHSVFSFSLSLLSRAELNACSIFKPRSCHLVISGDEPCTREVLAKEGPLILGGLTLLSGVG